VTPYEWITRAPTTRSRSQQVFKNCMCNRTAQPAQDRSPGLGSQVAQKQALAATDDSPTAHAVNASVWPALRDSLLTST